MKIFSTVPADAPISYAANSSIQGNVIANAKPVLKQLVVELCSKIPHGGRLVVADLGCAYGPNAFAVMSGVLDAVTEGCRNLRRQTLPEVQFFLYDLRPNDFNNVFRSLSSYKKKLKEEKGEEELAGRFYVAGVAGSFHERLFPCKSVHLFHSSSSIHWLSQVPEGLKDENNNELNKGNIYVGRMTSPSVRQAYSQQFQRDFSAFLRCRSEEIQDGGLMDVTVFVRSSSDPFNGVSLWCDLITQVLKSMAAKVPEGLKDENSNELNKGNIYVGRMTSPCVQQAYSQQFRRDFSAFLRCRSEEIQDGGLMAVTVFVRSSSDPFNGASLWCDLITQVLKSMAAKGRIKEGDIDALNIPFYCPSIEELHACINDHGAFRIDEESLQLFETRGDYFAGPDEEGQLPSSHMRGQRVVRMLRAGMGTVFACHFGEENIVDDMFARLASLLTRELEAGMKVNLLFALLTLRRNNAP